MHPLLWLSAEVIAFQQQLDEGIKKEKSPQARRQTKRRVVGCPVPTDPRVKGLNHYCFFIRSLFSRYDFSLSDSHSSLSSEYVSFLLDPFAFLRVLLDISIGKTSGSYSTVLCDSKELSVFKTLPSTASSSRN